VKAKHRRRRGAGLIIALTTLLVVMLMTGALVRSLMLHVRQSRQAASELQALWLADAAAARAGAQMRLNPQYAGETWRAAISGYASDDGGDIGVAQIRVERPEADSQNARLTIEARYPDHPVRRVAISRTYLIPIAANQPSAGGTPEENSL
jgi:type II secretory pathway component PulK